MLISDNPGPASYNDKVLNAFNDSQSKTTSFKRNPFNQTSTRFASPSQKARNVPGPTRYHLPSFTEENLRRAVIEDGRKPPFNVAAVRRFTMIRKDAVNMPGRSNSCPWESLRFVATSTQVPVLTTFTVKRHRSSKRNFQQPIFSPAACVTSP